MEYRVGDRVFHRFNLDLGPGIVREANQRRVVVEFPETQENLEFAASTDALRPLSLAPGARATLDHCGEPVVVQRILDSGWCLLDDGRKVTTDRVWPIPEEESPIASLARGDIGPTADFKNRLEASRLENLREASGLGSFLGGRIRLYPHQLYAAESACARDPVRWLLADGVGLGKTVEACLIMNHLIHTKRAERTLVVCPESLTVQWLGELWRKHHQIFTLLDDNRIAAVELDQGADFNPFEVHQNAIIALEYLSTEARLVDMAVSAGIDLLVVDEAHHLRRDRGHPGNSAYRAIAPIAAQGRHLLLLSATPIEDDGFGFLRLVQLLRPDALPEGTDFDSFLERRQPLPACTTATRASDIGGWPPRTPHPVDLDEDAWRPFLRLERAVQASSTTNQAQLKRKARTLARLSSSPEAARDLIGKSCADALEDALRATDPRLDYLSTQAPKWRAQGQKTLVFVAHRESLELVKSTLERRAHIRVGLFHEDLSVKRRDIEVAQLRLPEGPSLLVSTECGGEGRNFEMCDRLVLFDLPWNPIIVEQRIGRLDRIGRSKPTEIVYFRPPAGITALVAGLYERLGIFRQSLGAIQRQLLHLGEEIEKLMCRGPEAMDNSILDALLERADHARSRVEEAALRALHRQPYHQDMAAEILSRVPKKLEELTQRVVLTAASRFGFDVDEESGERTFLIALGSESLIDYLPGVAPDARFLGTFDREQAVQRETIDFFSSGHPLVEGILRQIHDGRVGRTACFRVQGEQDGFGILALYHDFGGLEALIVDPAGRLQKDSAQWMIDPETHWAFADSRQWAIMPQWGPAIHRLAESLPADRQPIAAAVVHFVASGS